MAKELEKTLLVNGEEYGINALNADKVTNSLVLTKVQLNGERAEVINFNGSVENGTKNSAEIVPASGGRFNGRITVPSVSDNVIGTDGETVLNYNDIVGKVVDKLINTSTVATWDDTASKLTFVTNAPSINGICVVLGQEINASVLHFAKYNMDNKLLPYYLYICSDTGNIWLGNYDSNTVTQLARKATNSDTADKLVSAKHFSVSLSSSTEVDFDGTNNVALGVTGMLPINKGGTGATTASDARTNLGITPSNIGAAAASHTHKYAGSSTAGGAATSAVKATQDSAGNTISSYYQPKILTGTVDPSSSTVSAVKNAPNGAIYIKY